MPHAFGVQFRVVEVDVRSYATDALVLKYAQVPYGADAQVIAATGVGEIELPAPGHDLMVRTPTGLPARHVVFLGVSDIRGFGYREIREFGMRALTTAARLENSQCRRISSCWSCSTRWPP